MYAPQFTQGMSADLLLLLGGIVLLYFGAELLVDSASSLALGVGIAPVTIGVTIIAFATTAPELFVSLIGAVSVSGDIGLGNIVGSNIANIGLVLGASALVQPLAVNRDLLWRHGSFMLAAVVMLVVLGSDGTLGATDGALLLAVLGIFTVYILRHTRRGGDEGAITDEVGDDGTANARTVGMFVLSVGVLLAGSRLLITGSVELLRGFGFTDLFIGLTVVAFGTSLPELATSMVSSARDEADLSISNVIGSNIYNILAVIGVLALVVPVNVPVATQTFEFPFLVAFTVGAMALMAHRHRVSRFNGLLLVAGYGAFVFLLFP
ncbi:calcium/sodium antiporter [Haladaptatus pallidirubidus]|uniref:Calcium/sodium antiporter n=1 Tax=Haladaptatus pallidirubidus TaxID=1008152 RepID=A0AAV3UKV9_9EURY|nr:calcium/sodium antiporter [Haladaptatus pallidirubidus]